MLAILLALDVVVGIAYLDLDTPPLVAGAGIAVVVAAARRHQLASTCAAAALSLTVTIVASRTDPMSVPLGGGRGLPIGTGQTFPSMAEVAGLAFLLGLALRSLRRSALVAGCAVIGAALIGVAGRSGDGSLRPLVVLAVALAASVSAGTGIYLRWVDHERQRDVDDARQSERLTIARELHDVVAHYVTGIVVQAQAAQEVWDESPAAARSAMAQIEAAGSDALRSMRHLVGELRNDDAASLTPTGHVDEISRLADRSTELGLPVRLDLEGLPDDLRPDIAASVNRIVTEAITNAQRHATDATAVEVTVATQGDALSIRVRDDGRGALSGPGPSAGYGMIGMTERAAALGGTLRAGPAPERGWLVEATLPLTRP